MPEDVKACTHLARLQAGTADVTMVLLIEGQHWDCDGIADSEH